MKRAADLGAVRHLALDMDGTLYTGGSLIPAVPRFFARIAELGIGHTFLTNNSSRSVAGYVRHLAELGIRAEAREVYTSGACAIDYLKREWQDRRRLFVLGTVDLREELAAAGLEVVDGDDEPDAVVVGFDTALDYDRLCKTAWWIRQGTPYLATHPDRVCPTDRPTVLVDCGAVCACLRAATGRDPDVVLGKPDPAMLEGILQREGLHPHELAVVGDRLYTDIAMAQRAGAVAVLVLTGETTRADLDGCEQPPDVVVADVGELADRLARAR